ncbi:MAG: TIGR03960 family B12-binding radical SAM protein [Lachnospiraceae bacterium]
MKNMEMTNRKLALSHDILMSVEKPARYIGGEHNSVMKNREEIAIRFAMCFPDIYEIGMSHLGLSILYGMFNAMENVWCERVFSPWLDLDKIMREKEIPLFALESQDPVKNFDFLGITLQYEMCYTNVLQILDLSQIPIFSRERTWEHPIVIGGGPCVYNPEPIADFFDLFYIGEGEVSYEELLALYTKCRNQKVSREDFLHEAGKIKGIYAPGLYEVSYFTDGKIKNFVPKYEDLPEKIQKVVVKNLDDTFYPLKPIVPFIRATQDRIVLEVQRGCIRGCRFCQAGQIYKPIRERSVEKLKEFALELMKNTGYEEISLSSLSTSDYTQLEELLEFLIEECSKRKINISLPSLRIDQFSLDVMNKVQDVRKSMLTFAPEAGSQRMRNVINKGLQEEDILHGAKMAFEGGWNKVKLYFMLGLPGETKEDIAAIPELCDEIARVYYETVPKENRNGRVSITASTSFFIPKPFTAFQWAPMNTMEEFDKKAYFTKQTMLAQKNKKSLSYKWHEAGTSIIEGVFARGDRKIGAAIYEAYNRGCIFDAWSEKYNHEIWMEAFANHDISLDFYIFRQRDDEEIFPWDFIDCGISKYYLRKEWQASQKAIPGTNCREKCSGCGATAFRCGICIMPR